MNKQFKIVNGQKINTKIEWADYSWNPIGGCLHGCEWTMPGGKIAACYAKDVAEGLASAAYPNGFDHHYWRPAQLTAPLSVKTPSRIFAGSMADVFGHWVPREHIEQVLDVVRKAHWHTFQFLTKNIKRAKHFDLPQNAWIGASTPPDTMWDRKLSRHQRFMLLDRTVNMLNRIADYNITWLSAEPLTMDLGELLEAYRGAVRWIVIGAASDGRTYYPPEEAYFHNLVRVADEQGIPLFFKGNLQSLPAAARNWREAFPA